MSRRGYRQVCARSGPVPFLGASLSPLEDHQPPRTGPILCPEVSEEDRRVYVLLYNPQEGWRDSPHGLVQ